MENASKALLIAGAVLICILLIGVGVMIFNASKGTSEHAKGTSEIMENEAKRAVIEMDLDSKFKFGKSHTGVEFTSIINDWNNTHEIQIVDYVADPNWDEPDNAIADDIFLSSFELCGDGIRLFCRYSKWHRGDVHIMDID